MDQRLSIVTLGVADLERARAFYLDGLGWKQVNPEDDGIVFIQFPGIVFALYPLEGLADDIGIPPPTEASTGGITLAYNTHSDVETDEVLAQAVAAGATLVKPAQKVFWGGYSGYFADPDGHLWEVAHNPFTYPQDDGTFVM